ncbi:MAG: hypothetical protein MI794_08065 [Pseudomonadales bacterium]|uniref:hypothetical protein n=1 Tax=Marinobacter xestospongiae TaxID=994319 RepID=UPI002002B214|nr:hypothetical protein [Marinobacter xestospongiae]MCG8517932.1 hypothetical protein [Pseudomonadales bacterium]MCK7565383.1 hypothetical protein [Marinobacter xestospongiae]
MSMRKPVAMTAAVLMAAGLAACSDNDEQALDLEQASDNAADIAQDAGDAAGDQIQEMTGDADTTWEKTKDTAGEVSERIGDAAEETGDAVEDGYNDITGE